MADMRRRSGRRLRQEREGLSQAWRAISTGCQHKVRYGSKVEAQQARRVAIARWGTPLAVYPCRACAGWHLGNAQEVR